MRHLTAVLIVLFIVSAPSCKYFKEKGIFGRKARALAALYAEQDSLLAADSIRRAQQHLVELENARLDSVRRAEAAKLETNQDRYNIIVGSFITPEYAQSYADYYRQQGYNPKILKMDGTSFELVAAEGHQSLRTAISRLEQFQDTVQIDAWIYIPQ